MDESGSPITNHQLLQVGDDLVIICEVSGGSPKPSVTWWREGSIFDDSYKETEYGVVINRMHYSGLRREDLGSKFVCQASNTNSTPPVSQEVHISLNCKFMLTTWFKLEIDM